jgi:predicted nucleotidyltransferase
VYGYTHPPNAFVCDPEYAPENLYRSLNQKAYRRGVKQKTVYYKFYFDEGLRFIQKNYPKHTVFYAPLRKHLVGVTKANIKKVRTPKTKFNRLMSNPPQDALVKSLQELYNALKATGNMAMSDFGVFGSLLHGFHHPKFSDLDLIIYGRKKLETLREMLKSLYEEKHGFFRNEFENKDAIKGKQWLFRNYSAKEFLWH